MTNNWLNNIFDPHPDPFACMNPAVDDYFRIVVMTNLYSPNISIFKAFSYTFEGNKVIFIRKIIQICFHLIKSLIFFKIEPVCTIALM